MGVGLRVRNFCSEHAHVPALLRLLITKNSYSDSYSDRHYRRVQLRARVFFSEHMHLARFQPSDPLRVLSTETYSYSDLKVVAVVNDCLHQPFYPIVKWNTSRDSCCFSLVVCTAAGSSRQYRHDGQHFNYGLLADIHSSGGAFTYRGNYLCSLHLFQALKGKEKERNFI